MQHVVSSNLSWSNRITPICSKAKKILLYWLYYNHVEGDVFKTSYFNCHTTPWCFVWDSYTLKDKRTLEQVQTLACKMASNHWDAGYKELLECVGLPLLEWRRSYLKLCLLFKITHGLCHFPTEIFTSGHISHNFRMNPCNYISCLHGLMQNHFCFILHTVSLWELTSPWTGC